MALIFIGVLSKPMITANEILMYYASVLTSETEVVSQKEISISYDNDLNSTLETQVPKDFIISGAVSPPSLVHFYF